MNITPVLRPTPQPFPKQAVTPAALAKPVPLTPMAWARVSRAGYYEWLNRPVSPKVPSNSITPLDFGFKYAAPCGILTVYTLDNGERAALAEMREWIVLHIRKTRCAPCDVAYYGLGDGPELQDALPL